MQLNYAAFVSNLVPTIFPRQKIAVAFCLRLLQRFFRRADTQDCPLDVGGQNYLQLQLAEIAVIGAVSAALGVWKALPCGGEPRVLLIDVPVAVCGTAGSTK